MSGPLRDKTRLIGDARHSRLLQSLAQLPDTLIVTQASLELTLIREVEGLPTMSLVSISDGGADADSFASSALDSRFEAQLGGAQSYVFLRAITENANEEIAVGAVLQVIPQASLDQIEEGEKRAQSLEDLLNDPKVDPRPLVRDVYTNLAMSLEESVVTFRMISQIHKQAVQNAVDIVQSKRLEFFESGESPNWNGIIFMIGVVMFIELAVVPVAASLIGGLVTGLARVSPKTARAVIGSAKAKELEKSIGELTKYSSELKELRRRLDSTGTFYNPKLIEHTYRKYDWVIQVLDQQIARQTNDVLKQQGQVYEQVVALIKSGKGKEHLAGLGKALSKDNVKTGAKVAKEISGGYVGKKSKHRPKQEVSGVVPLDILLKKNVQNVFDNAMWEAERLLLHVKRVGSLAQRADPSDPAHRAVLVRAIQDAPFWEERALELDAAMSPVHAALDDPGIDALSIDLAKDYELRIWVMLFATRYTAHRALGISSTLLRTGGASFWKFPAREEDLAAYPVGASYRHFWRDIDRKTYVAYEKEGYIVGIVARGGKGKREALMGYLRARFDQLAGLDDDAIAEFMANTHAALNNPEIGIKKYGLSQKELDATGILWQHLKPSEPDPEDESTSLPSPDDL